MWHLPFHRGASFPTRARTNILVSLSATILIGMLLAACGGPATTAQATPPPLVPLTPTATATPSPTPTLVPTPTPTPVPTQAPAPTQPPPPHNGPAILDLTPASMSIVGHLDCADISHVFSCQARVLSRSSNQNLLKWTASNNFASNVSFSPRGGTLSPGTSVIVTIFVPDTDCGKRDALFIFTGQSNQHTITWAC